MEPSQLQKLANHFKRFTVFDLTAEYFEADNKISLSTTHYGVAIREDIDLSKMTITQIMADDELAKAFILRIDKRSSQLSMALFHQQLKMVETAYLLFIQKYAKPPLSGLTIPTPMDLNLLDSASTQLFVSRIGENCRAVARLSGNDIETFLAYEPSIGVILRSCVLDSLLIAAWCIEPRYIQQLAAESFRMIGKVDPIIKKEYEALAKNLNPNNYKFKRHVLLEKAQHIEKADELYLYYSKYDHFSLIPSLLAKSPGNKIGMALKALEYIRLSMFTVIEFSADTPSEDFLDPLGVVSRYDKTARSYQIDTIPLKELLYGH